jgi:hypothetical protein
MPHEKLMMMMKAQDSPERIHLATDTSGESTNGTRECRILGFIKNPWPAWQCPNSNIHSLLPHSFVVHSDALVDDPDAAETPDVITMRLD